MYYFSIDEHLLCFQPLSNKTFLPILLWIFLLSKNTEIELLGQIDIDKDIDINIDIE